MQILMYQRSFDRLRTRLASELPDVPVAAMDDSGQVRMVVGDRLPGPTMAWADLELYDEGPVRDFMVYCLKSPSLTFFQSGGAGLDHPVFGMLADRGVVLANSNANSISVAEYALACVFEAFQPFDHRRQAQAERRWETHPGREVSGSHWLVVGMGSIGRAIGARARACGAHVTGVRRSVCGDEPADRMLTVSALAEAVSNVDVIVLCAAANPDNTRMFNHELFSAMTSPSVFINVARGSLVDEAALVQALDRGTPARAYLDVFAQEPLPDDSPLWLHPRVRISAHCAGSSAGTTRRNDDLFMDNARRLLAGHPPTRVVPADEVRASIVLGASTNP